jgi:hypothetical protein
MSTVIETIIDPTKQAQGFTAGVRHGGLQVTTPDNYATGGIFLDIKAEHGLENDPYDVHVDVLGTAYIAAFWNPDTKKIQIFDKVNTSTGVPEEMTNGTVISTKTINVSYKAKSVA